MSGVTLGEGWVEDGQGNRIPVWSGEFHYFRNAQKHWPRILKGMKDAGCTFVTSFVQPNWHEYEPGKFDFEGRTAPERDLPRLLTLAQEAGLYVQLRLGPACCEWRESGGSSFGTKWHDISNAFWDVVEPYQADRGGPLMLYQVHNEWVHPLGIYYIILPAVTGFDGFTAPSVNQWAELIGPNCHYLAAGYGFSMSLLTEYLAALYPDVTAMNRAWGADHGSFEAVTDEFVREGVDTLHGYVLRCRELLRNSGAVRANPRRMLDLLNWANLLQVPQLAKEADHTRTRTSLPVLHNWAMGDERRWSKMAHLDLSGYDMYAPMDVDIWDWAKMTCHMQSSPFPFSNEFMCGTIERYEWGGQGIYTDGFARMSVLSYVMGGMKGVNLYMFVERDNWLQCPLDERGGKRSVHGAIASIFHTLRECRWHELTILGDLGVFKNPDYHRYADGTDDGMFDEGYREILVRDNLYGGHEPKRSFIAAYRALRDRSVDFSVFKDTRGGESLRGFRTVLAYSLWFMDSRSAEDLLRFVEEGGSLVLYPCVPTHSDDGSELEVFTGRLGLRPFASEQTADIRVPPESVDIDAVLTADSGDFHTPSGALWAQSRIFGRGRVIAVNADPGGRPEALDRIVTEWGECRKYVDTDVPLTDGSMAVDPSSPESGAVVVLVNGRFDAALDGVRIDVSKLSGRKYTVFNTQSGDCLGEHEPTDGVLRVPVKLGPRDGTILRVLPDSPPPPPAPKLAAVVRSVHDWFARREDQAEYNRRYLGPKVDDTWMRVPLADWTLPAIAGGRVFGVQGWFYLKTQVRLPVADQPVYLRVRPHGYHNLGVVYLNGSECGRYAIERPGAESIFDVTRLVLPDGGLNTLAVRLYRQSLDTHDRGSSGFELLRFECGGEVVDIDEMLLKQERRDWGEAAGWASADPSVGGWEPMSVPFEISMDRSGDALWLRADTQLESAEDAVLRLDGCNCVVSVFINGEYVVKSPVLPCELPMREAVYPGRNSLALRITPDNFENYHVPKDRRYETYIRDGFLPLAVRLDRVEIVTAKGEVK